MRLIYLITGYGILALWSNVTPLTTEQNRQIRICVNAYTSAIQKYSSGEDPGQRINLTSNLFLIDINTNSSLKRKHFNDLNSFESIDKQDNDDNESISKYLRSIDEEFHYN